MEGCNHRCIRRHREKCDCREDDPKDLASMNLNHIHKHSHHIQLNSHHNHRRKRNCRIGSSSMVEELAREDFWLVHHRIHSWERCRSRS
jgi:hypothetical protein